MRTPLRERCKRLAQKLLPVVLHCGDGLAWNGRLAGQLRRWENRMLRRIVHLPPKPDEKYVAWHRRCVAVGRRFFETILEFEPATVLLLRKNHKLSKAVRYLTVPCGDYDVPVQCHHDWSYMLPAAVYFKTQECTMVAASKSSTQCAWIITT